MSTNWKSEWQKIVGRNKNIFWSIILACLRLRSNSNLVKPPVEGIWRDTRSRLCILRGCCVIIVRRTRSQSCTAPRNSERAKKVRAVCTRFCRFRNASSNFAWKPDFCVDENESITPKNDSVFSSSRTFQADMLFCMASKVHDLIVTQTICGTQNDKDQPTAFRIKILHSPIRSASHFLVNCLS